MIMKTPQRKLKQKSKGVAKSKRDILGSSVLADNKLMNSENSKKNDANHYLHFFKSCKKNNKVDVSYSSKYENKNTKSKSKTHSTKATKNDQCIQQVSHFEEKYITVDTKNKNNNKQIIVIDSPSANKQFINQMLYQRKSIVDKKKMINDFMEQSLELFNLSQQNLTKRKNLLKHFKKELNESWKKLYDILQNLSSGDSQQIVQQAIKMLVAQRIFIEQENKKIEQISMQSFRI